jgi:glycosyltransferase involved in cell wall biosynthesis
MPRSLTVLCAAKLFPNQLERHLEPLDLCESVERILVVRHAPIGDRLKKVEQHVFADGGTALNLGRMFATIDRLLRRERVDVVVGFNPVPWGSVACAAALRHRVPVSLSFIGTDFKQMMRPSALALWPFVRRARCITVTGERMRRGLIARGIPEGRIHVLPHVIDTDRFSPGASAPDLDIVSVGRLIRTKRMDVIIDAVAELRRRGRSVRAGILGEGPLRDELEQQIALREVADSVELLGFRNDVENVLRRARLFVLASESEGVPFAMIEAMCTGLVPIVTDVGTIADWVVPGHNGELLPVGDVNALADCLERLLGDPSQLASLRDGALVLRSSLSLERGAAFWRDVLSQVSASTEG